MSARSLRRYDANELSCKIWRNHCHSLTNDSEFFSASFLPMANELSVLSR